MAKKRKSDATRLDEVDRNMYSTFRSAANHLSQLYTQAMNQQKLAFQAGERHAMEKLYQWILRQHEEGSRVPAADIVAYLQNEIDYGGEDASVPPRLSSQHHQHSQPAAHMLSSGTQTSSVLFGQSTVGHAPRNGIPDESKNSVFSNALSSPIRRSLQPYHLAQGGEYYQNNALPTGNGARNNEAFSRDTNPVNSNDSSMDMHSDSSAHESY